MKDQCWNVTGVHEGKQLLDLPITYLLWFVGSPVMRRTRWKSCQIALAEIRRRLRSGTAQVETDLMAGLQRKSLRERGEIKLRRKAYAISKLSNKTIA